MAAVSCHREKNGIHPIAFFNTKVSFDGTWMKRGHSSHVGLQPVVLHDTGCVIDYNVFCTDCKICSRIEK